MTFRILSAPLVRAGGLVACLAFTGVSAVSARVAAAEAGVRGVVYVRVIGDIEVAGAADLPADARPLAQRTNVEVATGSGFLFSPGGQVLTCHHVVSDAERTATIAGRKVRVRVTVRRIDVQVPAGADGGSSSSDRFEATVIASSPDLDLAVLSIAASNVPHFDLGDSDALEPGDTLDAVGFPFGEDVEIGRPVEGAETPPDPSLSRGSFSAFRMSADGLRRFIQTTAAVNPGNSGGPILDADGFVVGVVARRLAGASTPALGIGFAIPINLVKEFLESRGLDNALPRRLTLGPLQALDGKGLRLRLPSGLADGSPLRTRVDAGAAPFLSLHADRTLSPWSAEQLAEAMVTSQEMEPFVVSGTPVQRIRQVGGRRAIVGRVSGTLGDGTAVRMEYAVIEVGRERILARYIGSASQVAYGAAVVRASLASIEADVLRRDPTGALRPTTWAASPVANAASPLAGIRMPNGWVNEPTGPVPCSGLPPTTEATSASAPEDFARSLRAGVLDAPNVAPADAAAACGAPASDDPGHYRRETEWLGTRYWIEGRFVRIDPRRLLQLEGVAPADQAASIRDLFSAWMSAQRSATSSQNP